MIAKPNGTSQKGALFRVLAVAAACALALAAATMMSSCAEQAKSTVTITLHSQAGTGYEWTYVASPEGAFTETAHETQASDDTAGGDVTDTFTFQAQQEGDVSITFMLERPWEDADSDAQLAQYVFVVDEAKNVTLDYKQGTYPDIPDPAIS